MKKFPLNPSLKDGGVDVTIPGSIGKMINGVEIFNYKTNDKIYFGPISDLNVLSGGSGYDVINPPKIEISEGVGTGATSVVCVKGKVVDAKVLAINSLKVTSLHPFSSVVRGRVK